MTLYNHRLWTLFRTWRRVSCPAEQGRHHGTTLGLKPHARRRRKRCRCAGGARRDGKCVALTTRLGIRSSRRLTAHLPRHCTICWNACSPLTRSELLLPQPPNMWAAPRCSGLCCRCSATNCGQVVNKEIPSLANASVQVEKPGPA